MWLERILSIWIFEKLFFWLRSDRNKVFDIERMDLLIQSGNEWDKPIEQWREK